MPPAPKEVGLVDSSKPEIRWAPPDVRIVAARLRSTLVAGGKAAQVEALDRLLSDPRMNRVWAEIYKENRSDPPGYKYPALTNALRAQRLRRQAAKHRNKEGGAELATALESEAEDLEATPDLPELSSEGRQDRAAAKVFVAAVHALNEVPIFLSDVKKAVRALRDLAQRSREIADQFRTFGLDADANELREMASTYAAIADENDPDLQNKKSERRDDYPLLIDRKTDQAMLRIFVRQMDYVILQQFGSSAMLSTIATLANVVFERTDENKLDRHDVRGFLPRVQKPPRKPG